MAQEERAPTALIFPSDVFDLPYEAPEHAFKQGPSSLGTTPATVTPDLAGLQRAADILNRVGFGARRKKHIAMPSPSFFRGVILVGRGITV